MLSSTAYSVHVSVQILHVDISTHCGSGIALTGAGTGGRLLEALLVHWPCCTAAAGPILLPAHHLGFLGGRAKCYIYMHMQRKKPHVSSGRPFTAKAASYPHHLI